MRTAVIDPVHSDNVQQPLECSRCPRSMSGPYAPADLSQVEVPVPATQAESSSLPLRNLHEGELDGSASAFSNFVPYTASGCATNLAFMDTETLVASLSGAFYVPG